jgi:hypothetical protein
MATLTMVMVLFFVMAMVAAYTNRNMLYEQRMAINNFRTTAAMAAADAGIDWAVAMLNGAPVDANCVANTPAAPGDIDFRSRYAIWQPDGDYVIPTWLNGGAATVFAPSCVMTAAGWSCRCPDAANAVPALPYPSNTAPIFKVEVNTNPGIPGLLTVDAWGSHEASAALSFGTFGNYNRIKASLGLVRALPIPPVATVTAGGTVEFAGANSKIVNADQKTGFTVHAGTPVLNATAAEIAADASMAARIANNAANAELSGAAGSVGGAVSVIESDADLKNLGQGVATARSPAPVDFFRSTFGMDSDTYRSQPAAVRIACPAGDCTSGDVNGIVAANPGRVIWVDGDLNLNSAANLGTPGQPVMMLATGKITLSSVVNINGFVYSDKDIVWTATAAGSVLRGALMAKGDFRAASAVVAIYDSAMMQRISLGYGSFARLPGSWQVLPIQ